MVSVLCLMSCVPHKTCKQPEFGMIQARVPTFICDWTEEINHQQHFAKQQLQLCCLERGLNLALRGDAFAHEP